MKIRRTIPPAAAPVDLKALFYGVAGFFNEEEYLKRLEREVRDYFNVKHVFLVSSGKAALTVILNALKSLSPERDEVLIPAYTCFSVPSAIKKAGLKVALCDIDTKTFDFQQGLLKNAINKKTLCVMPNHLFGIPSDVKGIVDVCREKVIFVLEDAAQAMGGEIDGNKIGTIGDAGFFSLGRGKNITCGSGGIIVTSSDRIAEAINGIYSELEYPDIKEQIKDLLQIIAMNIFIRPSLYWLPSSLPNLKLGETIFYKDFPIKRFSGIKAGLLWKWQERLELFKNVRKETARFLSECIGLQDFYNDTVPYPRLPLIASSKELRDKIYSDSREKGIGISLMYPTPINEVRELEGQFNGMTFPLAKMVSERLLTIPTHQFVSKKDKEDICRLFKIYGAISGSDLQQKNVEDLSGRHPESGEHEAHHYN
ncbi:MAG: aminotransferase class V-fold PLP-dependent enzyme [Nitrospirota bacterium]